MSPGAARSAVRAGGVVCFFAGIFFLAQAYTMAFLGMYMDCFGNSPGCSMRAYEEPTLLSALYGSFLALCAVVTFYVGIQALRWRREQTPRRPGPGRGENA
jgi:hypothetical protein